MSFLQKINPLSKTPVTLLLHVDMGEGSCRGALLKEGAGTAQPEMIFTTHLPEVVSKDAHGKNFSTTLASIRTVLEEVVKYISAQSHEGKHYVPAVTYVILGAPYYLSHTAIIKFKEKAGFTVTPQMISNLLHGYKKSADPEFESHDEVELGDKPITVSERIVHVRVNGYDTANPYGKKAEAIDISVFKTEMDSAVVTAIEKEVKKHFRGLISFEPLSLAAYIAIRDRVHFEPDFLFAVVGNEVTEVSLVRGFTLLETVSFPFGKHSLMRHLSRTLKSPEEMVAGTLALYADDRLHESEKTKLNGTLESAGAEWMPFFEKALVSLSDQSAVPHAVYLVSDAVVQKVFKSFIERDSYANQSLVPSSFSVTAIDPELAKSLMNFGHDASCDTILCLEGLFAVSTKLPLHNFDE